MAVNRSNVHPHEELIKEVYAQMREIFEESKQAIYMLHHTEMQWKIRLDLALKFFGKRKQVNPLRQE